MLRYTEELSTYFSADKKRLEFLEPILPIFHSQLNLSIESIKIAHKENNYKKFSYLTHKIKGSALTFGTESILSETLLIEKELLQTDNVNSIRIDQLIHSVDLLNKIYP